MDRVIGGGHSCASSYHDSRAASCLPALFRVDGAHRLDGVGLRVRRSVGFEGDWLAAENQRFCLRTPDRRRDLGRGGRDVVTGARVDAHVVAVLVHLSFQRWSLLE